MRRSAIILLLFAAVAWAVNVKLYLKDGGYQLAREYQVLSDRVRYYSVERGDWEEIPLELIDLKRTEKEAAERRAELANDVKALSEEAAAERAIRGETSRIPQDPGVYWLEGKQTKTLKAAEASVHINKKRQLLKVLAPIGQALSGKGTLEIEGAHSANVFSNRQQEFYIQLSEPERFGIVKLTSKPTLRIVENLVYLPVDKDGGGGPHAGWRLCSGNWTPPGYTRSGPNPPAGGRVRGGRVHAERDEHAGLGFCHSTESRRAITAIPARMEENPTKRITATHDGLCSVVVRLQDRHPAPDLF